MFGVDLLTEELASLPFGLAKDVSWCSVHQCSKTKPSLLHRFFGALRSCGNDARP